MGPAGEKRGVVGKARLEWDDATAATYVLTYEVHTQISIEGGGWAYGSIARVRFGMLRTCQGSCTSRGIKGTMRKGDMAGQCGKGHNAAGASR